MDKNRPRPGVTSPALSDGDAAAPEPLPMPPPSARFIGRRRDWMEQLIS